VTQENGKVKISVRYAIREVEAPTETYLILVGFRRILNLPVHTRIYFADLLPRYKLNLASDDGHVRIQTLPFAVFPIAFSPTLPMKKILTVIALLLSGLASSAQSQISTTEEAFALAKASGRSVFLLGGLKN
jgi:hypothetical protein